MVLFESGTTLHTLLGDHQNTVRDVLNTSGTVVNHLVYDTYGKLKSQTGGGAYSPFFGFTGKHFDSAVGLQYNLNRWYDPTTGRWTSEDPIGFGGGHANLYAYTANSPVNGIDPRGLQEGGQRRTFQARRMLYDNLRGSGQGAAVDEAHGIHNDVRDGFDTAVRMTPVIGDGISIIEITTGENATRPGETLSDGDRATEAGLFMLPGILEMGGKLLRRFVSPLHEAGGLATRLQAGTVEDANGLTTAARAIDKHGVRPGSAFPRPIGGVKVKNEQAQSILQGILTSNNQSIRPNRFGGQDIFDNNSGRGVRYGANGQFIAFLEMIPMRP
jgi:RHS repeat-associated protein